MELFPWILVFGLAGLVAVLATRLRDNPYPEALKRLRGDLEEGGYPAEPPASDPAEVAEIRSTLRRMQRPGGPVDSDSGDQALRGLFRYLRSAVLAPLESAAQSGADAPELMDALDALRDLEFYAREASQGPASVEVLAARVLEVTREYTLTTGVPVKYHGPPEPLHVRIESEAFKDGLYLLLANAGHFGGRDPVGVVVESDGEELRLRVRDDGPGFSREALESAFEPFWTTESDALGLGLTHARRAFERQGLTLEIANRDEGGGEAVIFLKREPRPEG